jgi:glutathione S-transferase
MDGVAVWIRELARPENERSPGLIEHETQRARRLLVHLEKEAGHPLLGGPLNIVQLTLGCAIGMAGRNPGFDWRSGQPKLAAWFRRIEARPSFAATAPPGAR